VHCLTTKRSRSRSAAGAVRRDEGRRHTRTACDMRSSRIASERGLRIRDDQGKRVFQLMRRTRGSDANVDVDAELPVRFVRFIALKVRSLRQLV
jgi:hypothetical protein